MRQIGQNSQTVYSHRQVIFGGGAIHLEYTEGRAARIVDFLFKDVPGDEWIAPHTRIRVSEEMDGTFSLQDPGEGTSHQIPSALLAQGVLEAVCFHLAAKSDSGLVLHAASTAWQGQGLLLPGRSGTGKTTLAAFLTYSGFRYLSDELVYVAAGSLAVEALNRPLKIKRTGLDVLRTHLDLDTALSQGVASTDDVLLPIDSLEHLSTSLVPISVVVFPRYREGADFSLEPLTPAQSGLRFMECLLNARNLLGDGFAEVTRVAAAVPAFEMRFAGLDQIAANLPSLRSLAINREARSASQAP